MSEELKKAKEAFASAKHSDATLAYVELLEKESKTYYKWWSEKVSEVSSLKDDVNNLQAEIDYLRSFIGHEFSNNYGNKV